MCGDSIVGGNKVTNFDAWYNNVFKFNSAKILDPNLDTLYFTRCITLTVKNLCFFFFLNLFLIKNLTLLLYKLWNRDVLLLLMMY
jgi:hypothetical protein